MKLKPFTGCICITLFVVQINAIPLKKNSGGENANQNNLSEYEKQLEDEDVRELKNLKSSNEISPSVANSEKNIGTSIDGKKAHHNIELGEQINKNGELMERIQQKTNSKQESESAQPRTQQAFSEIETVPKSNQKWLQSNVQLRDNFQKKMIPVNQKQWNLENVANNLLDQFKLKNVVKYLPVEMAEYIYQTGDERSVILATENYLRLGIMDRDEAIAYLQEIKFILNTLKENEIREKKQEQRRYTEVYENSRSRVDMNQALSDLRDIQQLIQNKFLKKSYNEDNFENENAARYREGRDEFEVPESYIDENAVQSRFSDKDYKNLAEKLQSFDNLFSDSSMEGVIYELAKVLFYQSYSMNRLEAREILKQFISFLESQVEEGHISRSTESKVLEILLAAITDAVNENPEILYEKSPMKQFPKQLPSVEKPAVPGVFKTVEKKSATGNKNRHDKMNIEVSGILDDDKHRSV